MAQSFHLVALSFVLRTVFAALVVAIPVVFQPELRSGLERLGRGDVVRNIVGLSEATTARVIGELSRASTELASQSIGALVVVERQTGLQDFVETGVMLDALISDTLLVSLFQPASRLHDGAVVIRGDRVLAARVFLPLTDEVLPQPLGTRHRAALGITQQSDAIVLVVSEETGTVSLAHGSELIPTLSKDLKRRLTHLLTQD